MSGWGAFLRHQPAQNGLGRFRFATEVVSVFTLHGFTLADEPMRGARLADAAFHPHS
jgi:hypothetical protein